ncbi:MAG: YgfZ/GcvT domain-containing protein [Burkholderiales bacterium]
MHATWQQHLRNMGARLADGVVQDFGDAAAELRAAESGTVLCDLSQFGLLTFAGEDAQAFLHAQFSSDVKKIGLLSAQYSAYCTAKGRLLANFLLWQSAAGFFAQMHGSVLASTHSRLAKFVLRSKVKISDVSENLVCLGLAGAQAETLIQKHFGRAPQASLGVMHEKNSTLIRLSKKRFEIIIPYSDAPAIWDALSMNAQPAGNVCWDWLNIRAGIPFVSAATQEQFVPQMANLELIGAVSFDKGCYPGQEIVARTQHLGILKRRMSLAHVDAAPQAGDALFSKDSGDQASGMIINAAPAPEGGYDLLAVMQISSAQNGDARWKSPAGPALKLLPMPYSV